MTSFLRRLGACSLLATLLGAAPASAQIKQFGEHWTAACDNQRNCSAYGVHFMWTPGYIRIDRAGTPEAPTKVTLAIHQKYRAKFTLGFDGPAPEILPKGTITPDKIDPDHFMRIPIEAPMDAVVEALRKARAIVYKPVEPIDPKEKHYDGEIALTGAIAALAWIDAQQKRTGTVTALIKRGDKPASAVPQPPPLPEMTAVISTAEAKPAGTPEVVRQKSRTACGKPEPKGEFRESTWLGDKQVMYWFFCMGNSGPYNVHYALLAAPIEDPSALRPVELRYPPSIAAIEKSKRDEPYNAAFKDKTGTLVTLYLNRAAGDCGTLARWVWTGSEFKLALLQKMPVCGSIESDDWPVLYRAQVK